MNANKKIESHFNQLIAAGNSKSIALDMTVQEFIGLNSMYIRMHIRHSELWNA